MGLVEAGKITLKEAAEKIGRSYRQAKRIYARFGYPERVDLVEAEGGHGVQPGNLVGIVRWMRRWLLGRDDAVMEPEIRTHPESDLLCTPHGQVMFLSGERSVFDFNRDEAKRLAPRRSAAWSAQSPAERIATVRRVAGIRDSAPLSATVDLVGTDVGQQLLQGWPFQRGAGQAAIVKAGPDQPPALVGLTPDIGLAGLALGIEGVELHVEAFLTRLAGVDGTALLRDGRRDGLHAAPRLGRSPKKVRPFQRVPVMCLAMAESDL